jgi:hypothetical protein
MNKIKPKTKTSGGMPVIPQAYKDGGKVTAFKGKDNRAEERAEAKMVRSGKVSPAQYAAKEKAEGDTKSKASLMRTGKDLASGRESVAQYGAMAKMNDGGLVRATGSMAPNECTYNGGPGVRSMQDYKK